MGAVSLSLSWFSPWSELPSPFGNRNLSPASSPLPPGIVEHGGHIVYKANVKQILMAEGEASPSGQQQGGEPVPRASGVKLADGRVFR